jgi:tetratricopeptide (TPR) repeat protein
MSTNDQDKTRLNSLSAGEREALEFEQDFYEKVLRSRPTHLEALRGYAHACTALGLYKKGLWADRRICAQEPENAVDRYNLSCSLALTGEVDAAIEELQVAAELGYRDWRHIRRDPDLANLHGDPRFDAIIADGRPSAD